MRAVPLSTLYSAPFDRQTILPTQACSTNGLPLPVFWCALCEKAPHLRPAAALVLPPLLPRQSPPRRRETLSVYAQNHSSSSSFANNAEPIRTRVAPSSTATSKSFVMPMDKVSQARPNSCCS